MLPVGQCVVLELLLRLFVLRILGVFSGGMTRSKVFFGVEENEKHGDAENRKDFRGTGFVKESHLCFLQI